MYLHVSNIQNLSSSSEQVDEKGQRKAENSCYYSQFLFDYASVNVDYWY